MNSRCILILGLLTVLWKGIGVAQTAGINQNFLSLTPDFAKATLNEGYGKIPFTVKSDSTDDIVFMPDWYGVVRLMTTDDSGNAVSIEDFRDPHRIRMHSGPRPHPVVLKPGQTGTYDSHFSMETLAFVAAKNKKIFGEIPGHTTHTNQSFDAHSASFPIPPELAKPPWNDIGMQNFLAVTVDSTKPDFQISGSKKSPEPGSQSWAFLTFPIKITNTTTQPLLVNSARVTFFKGKQNRKSVPDLWELVMGMKPVPGPNEYSSELTLLKPGESVEAGGYITMWNNLPDEWKKGEPLFVGVAGRIPDTNKVFESYSAPFGFPAEPGTN
jgi:hypothetical protein